MYLLTVHSFTSIISDTVTKLQSDEPMISNLLDVCEETIMRVARKFLDLDDDSEVENLSDLPNVPRLAGDCRAAHKDFKN